MCFGSGCPRYTLGDKGLSAYMRYHTQEKYPNIAPWTYDPLKSFKQINEKVRDTNHFLLENLKTNIFFNNSHFPAKYKKSEYKRVQWSCKKGKRYCTKRKLSTSRRLHSRFHQYQKTRLLLSIKLISKKVCLQSQQQSWVCILYGNVRKMN